jgi:hypothetical protein
VGFTGSTVLAVGLVVLALAPGAARAAQEHAPRGTGAFGHVHALAVNAGGAVNQARPTALDVATLEGVIFRSADGGATWTPSR